ncbi:MAG: hypothetical protein M3Q58_03635 [Bacteroidota bacterium]|nr:hypothetical protein [Bacteroidota bacterium]
MIDLTTVELSPAPRLLVEQIESLQEQNLNLAGNNKTLSTALVITAIVIISGIGVMYVVYKNYSASNDDRENRKSN